MSFWRRLFGKQSRETLRPQRLDYLNEGLALERQGDYEAALTSYRLAFRDNPERLPHPAQHGHRVHQDGQPEEAIRHYKRALELDDTLGGAHYGVAFLLLKRGDVPARPPSTCAPFSPGRPRAPTPTAGSATPRPRCGTSQRSPAPETS